MLKDTIPFDRVWRALRGSSPSAGYLTSFIHFLENRLGAELVYDQARIGYEPLELIPMLEMAERLRARGIIRSYKRSSRLPDEPRVTSWLAEYAVGNGAYEMAGGSTLDDSLLALTKTLAEAIERNAWSTYSEFASKRSASLAEIENDPLFIHPESFASYTLSERTTNPRLTINQTDSFLWVKGYSWVQESPVWVPVQVVSGHPKLRAFSPSSREPAIRPSITTGIATHPVRTKALLSGALEVIERDAFMITWLNQLQPTRIDLNELALQRESLARLLERCRQYHFEPHAMRLPTDAPAYVVCVMLEDTTGALPRFSVGSKAHGDATDAVEGALLEALRMHQVARKQKLSSESTWDPATKAADITHYNRLRYWAEPGRGDRLAFLIQGEVQPLAKEAWEVDTSEEHFARIVKWCKEKNYELASVSFSPAPANVPNWHIEFIVIPQLQPLYFNEKLPCVGGERLATIPKQFGFTAQKPYTDEPHPFV